MRDEPETIDLATYRRLTQAVPRKRAKREPKAGIPRTGRDEPAGLTDLMKRGWSPQTYDCVAYRLYQHGGLDTGMQPTLKAACRRAKELERETQH